MVNFIGPQAGTDETGEKVDKIMEGFRSIESYKFMNNFHDVIMNTSLGIYGHTVITHNIYDKSYREDDYHYHNRFNQTNHLEDFPFPA